MTRDELEQMSQEDLDEAVHEAKAEEAAEINNNGRSAQILYLLGEDRIGLAPGSMDELSDVAKENLGGFREVRSDDAARAVIVGLRADPPPDPKSLTRGSTADFACWFCTQAVYLAPSSKKMVDAGAQVVCSECMIKVVTITGG